MTALAPTAGARDRMSARALAVTLHPRCVCQAYTDCCTETCSTLCFDHRCYQCLCTTLLAQALATARAEERAALMHHWNDAMGYFYERAKARERKAALGGEEKTTS